MTASATGDSRKASRFNCHAAKTKIPQETITKVATKAGDKVPDGMARVWVRGLAASIEASARRLKAIAAERAPTIATTIQISVCADGHPPAASMAPHMANGSTKMECSHLIISRVTPRLRRMGTERL